MFTRFNVVLFMMVLIPLVTTSNAHATCESHRCVGLVERLYVDSGALHVEIQGNKKSLACAALGERYLSASRSHPMMTEWHGMVLGAFLSGRPVWISIDEKSRAKNCQIRYIVLEK